MVAYTRPDIPEGSLLPSEEREKKLWTLADIDLQPSMGRCTNYVKQYVSFSSAAI